MTQSAKAQEPSMEEILASIRRIIADDDAAKPAAPAVSNSAKPAAPVPPPKPVLIAPPSPAAPAAPVQPLASSAHPVSLTNDDEIDSMLAAMGPATESEMPNENADVFELTEDMTAPVPPQPAPSAAPFRTIDGDSDVVFTDAKSRSPIPTPPAPNVGTAEPAALGDARPQFTLSGDRSLLSPSASSAVDAAFNTLAQTVLVQNARTLEDLVREMLRPMLKSWLDDNLPNLVERIVKAEIERVSRGRV
jgi:cell pole-organizing protein PopZ